MRILNRIWVLAIVILLGASYSFAQQKEYKKLQKEGVTTEGLKSFTEQFPDFAPRTTEIG